MHGMMVTHRRIATGQEVNLTTLPRASVTKFFMDSRIMAATKSITTLAKKLAGSNLFLLDK